MDEGGSEQALTALKEAGYINAYFAGHYHLDNYWGDLDGIGLHFLRATGAGGYGGLRLKKGGTLITVDETGPAGRYQTLTVFPDGRTWSG